MGPTTDSGISQVFGRVLDTVGYGLSRAIDAEYQQPWGVNDPAAYQYAIGPQGGYYTRGLPANVPGATTPLNPLLLILGVAAVGLLVVTLKG